LEESSPLLEKIMPPVYELSTSQTPLQQTDNVNLVKNPSMATAGGGFGPVSERGYGVSYIVVGENMIGFHVSSKRSAPNSSSAGFRNDLLKSLRDMRALFPDKTANDSKPVNKLLEVPNGSEKCLASASSSTATIGNL